jgi:hypothetical protein
MSATKLMHLAQVNAQLLQTLKLVNASLKSAGSILPNPEHRAMCASLVADVQKIIEISEVSS